MQQFSSIVEAVGNTPLVEIQYRGSSTVPIFAKLEWYNPSGSVKDRAAKAMFMAALKAGELDSKVLLDATSGNTGIAYAMLGAYYQKPVKRHHPNHRTDQEDRCQNNQIIELYMSLLVAYVVYYKEHLLLGLH